MDRTERTNETKNWFFEKIDKSLAKLTKRKRNSSKIRVENRDYITGDSNEIQKIIRMYFKT